MKCARCEEEFNGDDLNRFDHCYTCSQKAKEEAYWDKINTEIDEYKGQVK